LTVGKPVKFSVSCEYHLQRTWYPNA
jgi:hypothetical protein